MSAWEHVVRDECRPSICAEGEDGPGLRKLQFENMESWYTTVDSFASKLNLNQDKLPVCLDSFLENALQEEADQVAIYLS